MALISRPAVSFPSTKMLVPPVIPDLAEISALRDERLTLEDCVCEAALGAASAQLRAGYPVRMPLVGARPSEIGGQFPADLPAFTDALLRVKFDSPYGYEEVLRLMLARFQRTGAAVLVTARLTTRIADMAMRMQRSGVATRLIWVSDDDRDESMALIERMNSRHGIHTVETAEKHGLGSREYEIVEI